MDKKIATIVFITIFLDLLGFGILIPIQPFLALSFSAPPSIVTLLGASFSLMQFLFMPLWGQISDRFGRRPAMLISIATSAIGFFIFAYADSLLLLFLSRMISGFGGANISCAQAIMADISDDKNRISGMGLVSSAIGLGFIVGPLLGGLLGAQGFMLPALAAGWLSLINLFLAAIFLKETRGNKSQEESIVKAAKKHGISSVTKRNLTPLFWLSFFIIMAFALFEQSIGIYLTHVLPLHDQQYPYEQSVRQTSIFLFLIASVSAIIQMTALKRLAAFFGERNLLRAGCLIGAFSLAALPLLAKTQSFYLLILPGASFAVGLGISLPCISSIISRSVSMEEQGIVLGQSQSYAALGRIIGPALCGVLFEYFYDLPSLCAALIFLLCSFMTMKISKNIGMESYEEQDTHHALVDRALSTPP